MRFTKVKYPRILVSSKRHMALQKEAGERNMTLEQIAEEKFIKADNQK